jgi:pimeloyl-ACP methyl ester carboxylesterase
VLLGHSWGAGLASQYALRFQDRVSRMLLVGPIPLRRTPYGELSTCIATYQPSHEKSAFPPPIPTARRSSDDFGHEWSRVVAVSSLADWTVPTRELGRGLEGNHCLIKRKNPFT